METIKPYYEDYSSYYIDINNVLMWCWKSSTSVRCDGGVFCHYDNILEII